ncbi:unnamed protein product [Ectocarpus fasciculatus]
MSFLDFRSDPSAEGFRDLPAAAAEGWRTVELGGTYADREIDAAFRKASAGDFKTRCLPASAVSREVGNCYTASVFAGLVSVVANKGSALEDDGGARVLMFSYGSGFIATAYSFKARRSTTCRGEFSLGGMQKAMGITDRLAKRLGRTPEDFAQASRPGTEQRYGKAGYTPSGATDKLFAGTFYLAEVNDKYHRSYERVPPQAS